MIGGRAAAQTPLRVCADPNYLPYSNRAGAGFENKIARSLAAWMHRPLQYTWFSERTDGGFDEFVRSTLNAHRCDVIVDVPTQSLNVQTTRAYYISSYVFVFPSAKHYDITSLDSPALQHLRIGFIEDTPPQDGLKVRELLSHSKPFLTADEEGRSPAEILDAVQRGTINVGITWEPSIGYYLHQYPGLRVVPLPNSRTQGAPEQYTFAMSMGVRSGDDKLQHELDSVLNAHRAQLGAMLRAYGVQSLENGG